MSVLRVVFGGCVSDRSSEALRQEKIKFGVPLSAALKNGYLPTPIVEIMMYIAKEGVTTSDLFRRPGNPIDSRRIIKRLSEGKPVILSNYNFYTLATVIKRFLLKIPGGLFGPDGEERLLDTLDMDEKTEQCTEIHEFITSLSQGHQQLISLLFGTWFKIVNHSEINFMTLEALSRSVAGSMFHSCATDPAKVEKASRLMQLLIDNFCVSSMFGKDNIDYFTKTTRTGIRVRETLRYLFPSTEIIPPLSDDEFLELGQGPSKRAPEVDNGKLAEKLTAINGNFLKVEIHGEDASVSDFTASAPEVSLLQTPEIAKRPKSLDDNLNDRTNNQKSLSRFNSVKRRQLERMRQRSDWFLGSSVVPRFQPHEILKQKSSGNSVTRASSEGAVVDVLSSDVDSVFSESSSRSESPVSEPVRSNSQRRKREIIHSDTLENVCMPDIDETRDLTDDDDVIAESDICYYKYGGSTDS